jgi:tryptophanyl-tRNA synthetase
MKAKDAHNLGRFAYPVLQAADIAIFRGIQVPVGQDQVPHLELAREIVRRFNHLYKTKLPEPQPLLTETPMITGTDGRKMSKSYGNVIPLLDEPKNIEKICKQMITDPQRVRRDDPGNPDVCSVFAKHKLFSSAAEVGEVDRDCRSAALGCGDCKLKLAANINAFMAKPLSIKKELLNSPSRLDEIIAAGNLRAAAEAERTMEIVRPAALGLKSKGSR